MIKYPYLCIITSDQMILNFFSSVLELSENLTRAMDLSCENAHVHRHKKICTSFFLQSSWSHHYTTQISTALNHWLLLSVLLHYISGSCAKHQELGTF